MGFGAIGVCRREVLTYVNWLLIRNYGQGENDLFKQWGLWYFRGETIPILNDGFYVCQTKMFVCLWVSRLDSISSGVMTFIDSFEMGRSDLYGLFIDSVRERVGTLLHISMEKVIYTFIIGRLSSNQSEGHPRVHLITRTWEFRIIFRLQTKSTVLLIINLNSTSLHLTPKLNKSTNAIWKNRSKNKVC